jgi:hypothetical protein
MSEMAQTATRLVVLGRGRLITETSVEDFTDHAAAGVLVRTPETARLGQVLAAHGVSARLRIPADNPRDTPTRGTRPTALTRLRCRAYACRHSTRRTVALRQM